MNLKDVAAHEDGELPIIHREHSLHHVVRIDTRWTTLHVDCNKVYAFCSGGPFFYRRRLKQGVSSGPNNIVFERWKHLVRNQSRFGVVEAL